MKKTKKIFIASTLLITLLSYNVLANFSHTVQHNETLWSIANYYDVPIESIVSLNPEINEDKKIYTNTQLIIPSGVIPVFSSSSVTSEENKLLKLINTERTKNNLTPLQADEQLTSLAKIKNNDMLTNNYFGHNSKVYENTPAILKTFNIPYEYFGENIAKGNYNSQQVFVDWINNDDKKNILNENFTKIGISQIDEDSNYWTIIFTG